MYVVQCLIGHFDQGPVFFLLHHFYLLSSDQNKCKESVTDRDEDAGGGFVVCGEPTPYLVELRVHAESPRLRRRCLSDWSDCRWRSRGRQADICPILLGMLGVDFFCKTGKHIHGVGYYVRLAEEAPELRQETCIAFKFLFKAVN